MKTIQRFFITGLTFSLLWMGSVSAQTYKCPPNLDVPSITINNLRIYRAQQQITLASGSNTFIVQGSAADVKVFAGQSIELNPDTHIKSGSKAWMRITPCSVGPGDDGGGGGLIGGGNRTTKTTVTVPQRFQIYPNPTEGKLTVTVPTLKNGEGSQTIEVYHLLGNLILRKKVSAGEKVSLDLTNQPKGVYLIKHITLHRVTVERIIYR